MNQSRILLLASLAMGLFYIAGFAALGDSFPTIDSSGEEIIDWFSTNGTGARIYAWTSAFLALSLAVFGGLVASLLPRPNGIIFMAGVLGFAITAQVQAWFWAGLTLHPQELAPGSARVIFDIPAFWGPLVNGSTATMAAAVAVLGFGRSPSIPRWLTGLSLLFFLEQAIETVTVFGQSGFLAPGGSMDVYLGGAIGFLWIVGTVRWALGHMAQPT